MLVSKKLAEIQNNSMKLIDSRGTEKINNQISLLEMIDNE
tara:strand:+ start:533 stop:652 length:120 start_codon:yes stop_codon:yes gene_type:complete